MKLREHTIVISETNDPWLNLAIEDWLFQQLTENQRILFLSRNNTAVVLGKFQNPWLECRVDTLLADNVPIVRRQSGGGTVFHDLGNTNYSFITTKELYDIDTNYSIILQALRALGIEAERTERNDLLVTGKKFSGSAFKKAANKVLHHGTLLHQGDKTKLHTYLSSDVTDCDAKGIRSVPGHVINLSDTASGISHESLVNAISEEFRMLYNPKDSAEQHITEADALENTVIRTSYDELRTWEWTFGKTPPFIQSLKWHGGSLEIGVKISTRHCVIEDFSLEISPGVKEHPVLRNLETILPNLAYRKMDVQTKINQNLGREKSIPPYISSFCTWLISKIYPSSEIIQN